jgi:hypothetical protein
MALAANPLGHATSPAPETPKIYTERYRHSIVDSSYQPETSLLTMVQGTPRRTWFYNPFINGDEETTPFGPGNAPTYQSYTFIENLIIKQEGNGAFTFDPEHATSTEDFTGWLAMDRVPLRNACFIADIGDGNSGLFMVTEQPEVRNVTANKVYYITFKLVSILTKEWNDMLVSRVVESFVYSKDSALRGGTSVLTKGEYQQAEAIAQWQETLSSYLLRTYYWNPERTFVYDAPDGRKVYDEYLVNFLCAMIPPALRGPYPFIDQFSTQYGGREFGSFGTVNVWEVLLRNDWNLLGQCNNQASYIETTRLAGTRQYGNLRSSKISWFVATDPERFLQKGTFFNFDGYNILTPSKEIGFTYLFTPEFYQGKPQTELEYIIVDTLKFKNIDRGRILAYCENYWNLSAVDKLYQGAILMVILDAARAVEGQV